MRFMQNSFALHSMDTPLRGAALPRKGAGILEALFAAGKRRWPFYGISHKEIGKCLHGIDQARATGRFAPARRSL
jgi:hypothetical protein